MAPAACIAADAAVTTALVAGVASPTSSGIGGGGFLVGWDAKTGKPYVIDFRETAPAAATANISELEKLLKDCEEALKYQVKTGEF